MWLLDAFKLWAWTKRMPHHPTRENQESFPNHSPSYARTHCTCSLGSSKTLPSHEGDETLFSWCPKLCTLPLQEPSPPLFTPWTEGSSFLLLPAQLLWKCSAFPLSHPTMAAPFISVRHTGMCGRFRVFQLLSVKGSGTAVSLLWTVNPGPT